MENELAIKRSELIQLRADTKSEMAQSQRAREIATGALDITDQTTWQIVRNPVSLREITDGLFHAWKVTNIGIPLSRAMHAALAAEQAAQQILVATTQDALEKAKQTPLSLTAREQVEGYKQTAFYMIDHLFGLASVNQAIIIEENQKLILARKKGRGRLVLPTEDPAQDTHLAYVFTHGIENGLVSFEEMNIDPEFVIRGARLGRNVFCEIYMQLGTEGKAR